MGFVRLKVNTTIGEIDKKLNKLGKDKIGKNRLFLIGCRKCSDWFSLF